MDIIVKQYYLFNTNKVLIDIIKRENVLVYTNISKLNTDFDGNKFNLDEITWKYNENNLRIPFNNNIKLNYYKLKEADNVFDFISSHSFISDEEIINGEKIQNFADVVIGSDSSLRWNPNNRYFSKEMQNLNNNFDIDKYKSIFVFTHDLELFNEKFKDSIDNKTIITHNSDHEINNRYNFRTHLCQNLLNVFDNTIPIPIGIENNQWFDNNIFYQIKNIKIEKTKNIYFYFNQNTHFTRKTCYEKLVNKLEWNISRPKNEYFIELAKHKYAICPRGNGLDTHRIWECLYLNTIPIVVKDDFININNLPIIILDSWDDLNPNKLKDEFSDQILSKLLLNYYKKIIAFPQI
jgi:hypothetical protein